MGRDKGPTPPRSPAGASPTRPGWTHAKRCMRRCRGASLAPELAPRHRTSDAERKHRLADVGCDLLPLPHLDLEGGLTGDAHR